MLYEQRTVPATEELLDVITYVTHRPTARHSQEAVTQLKRKTHDNAYNQQQISPFHPLLQPPAPTTTTATTTPRRPTRPHLPPLHGASHRHYPTTVTKPTRSTIAPPQKTTFSLTNIWWNSEWEKGLLTAKLCKICLQNP